MFNKVKINVETIWKMKKKKSFQKNQKRFQLDFSTRRRVYFVTDISQCGLAWFLYQWLKNEYHPNTTFFLDEKDEKISRETEERFSALVVILNRCFSLGLLNWFSFLFSFFFLLNKKKRKTYGNSRCSYVKWSLQRLYLEQEYLEGLMG